MNGITQLSTSIQFQCPYDTLTYSKTQRSTLSSQCILVQQKNWWSNDRFWKDLWLKKKFRDKNFFDNRIIVGTNNDQISPNCGLGVRTPRSVMIRASVGYTTPRGTTPPISRWLAFSTFPFIHSPHSGSSQASSSSLSLYWWLCLHSGRSGIHSLVILPACMFDFSFNLK